MRIKRQAEENLEPQLAPLIDCMFILLIFFLVSTTMKKVEKELPIDVPPSAAGIEKPEGEELLILSIDATGRKYVRAEPVTTGELLERLGEEAALNPERRIRLDADRNTRYLDIVEVIEAARFHGMENIGLRIKAPYDKRFH